MAIAKHPTYGTAVKHGTTAAPTVVLGQLKSVSFNPGARTLVDVTTHDNTVSKSYIDSGLRDTAELDMVIELGSEDTGHEAVRAAQANGTLYYFTLVLTSGTPSIWALSGYILDASIPTMGTNGDLMMNIKFKAIGAGTYTQ